MSARSRLDAVTTVAPRYFAPKQVATPERLAALIAVETDEVVRRHLQAQLDAMEGPASADPFRGVQQGPDDSGWWTR
jgi:hypothetical protein